MARKKDDVKNDMFDRVTIEKEPRIRTLPQIEKKIPPVIPRPKTPIDKWEKEKPLLPPKKKR